MRLTVGTGPFGHRPYGRFDFDPPSQAPTTQWSRTDWIERYVGRPTGA